LAKSSKGPNYVVDVGTFLLRLNWTTFATGPELQNISMARSRTKLGCAFSIASSRSNPVL